MTEREFRRWLKYRADRLFPTDRIVLQLAQIAFWVARTVGIENAKITDYLLEREPEHEDAEVDIDEAREFFGFPPRA